jgi:hypothetical protein
MCGNKDLCVIFQKYESFYAKYLNYKCNFQFLQGVKFVKVVVIITLHENLQLSPRLHEIYPNKDKNFKKFEISPRF